MNHTFRTGGASLALLALISMPIAPAEAATRSWDDAEREWSRFSSRGYSSAIQKKINNLDDDEVEELPIPILLGVSTSNLARNYGDPRDGGSRSHQGLDIMAPTGAYIVSPTEAVVTRVGKGETEGNYVYTANPGGETFAYMHLDDVADGIKAGTELEEGDLIGYVGNTGNASGGPAHLHFEIRESSRKHTDPFPRLEREFTLTERIDAIERILEDADDEEEEAEMLVRTQRGLFILAGAQKVKLPKSITEAMEDAGIVATGNATFVRDLTLGSTGNDVTALQALLITKDSGPATDALAKAGATGYFGPITQKALAEYQAEEGIIPAAGYFGPLTRAMIAK